MSPIAGGLRTLTERFPTDDVAAPLPNADVVVAPKSAADAAEIYRFASEHRLRLLAWGRGTHQGFGYEVAPDIVVMTHHLAQIVDWQPEDLTLVVGSGMRAIDVEEFVAERRLTAVLPERPGDATLGGVVSAGLSGWRRARYGPTRDRVLETQIVTGDGRVVRAGGRVVKNVTGYDLPRLVCGSFGALGLITEICLKLWPRPVTEAMVPVADPGRAREAAFRPHAVLATENGVLVYLGGTGAEVEAQADELGGSPLAVAWPDLPNTSVRFVVRVRPRYVSDLVGAIRARVPHASFIAGHGVGDIQVAADAIESDAVLALRSQAEAGGGSLVLERSTGLGGVDPWGTPPPSLALQRRVKAAFDPRGVANPGILPGGL